MADQPTTPAQSASERAIDQLIDERDQAHDAADKLAQALAELLDLEIGEHSSFNDPWLTALVGAQRAIDDERATRDGGAR